MQANKIKNRLHLVTPLDVDQAANDLPPTRPAGRATRTTPRTSEYFRRVEAYAERIRSTEDVSTIINILDEALTETRAYGTDPKVRTNPGRLQQAEREIEALQIELRQLRGLVHVDHLTGMLNRGGLDLGYKREAARADRSNSPLGIALLDLDNFKHLNDHHGHQAGDAALVHIADIIRRTVRPSDVVVRYGGEEFLFLLPESDTAQAARALQRLQDDLQRHPLVHHGIEIPMSFSAGVTTRRRGQSRDDVIAQADQALYAAKRAGKMRVMAAGA
jgi:diguanylate cyclase